MGILTKLGTSLVKKTSKDSSKEVAKRGSEVMSRKPEKFMGMAEEVQPKRLSGPAASAAEETTKRGSKAGAVAAGAAAAAGVAAMASRDKEDKKESPTKAVAASRVSGGKVEEYSSAAAETSKAKEAAKPSTFGAAFKEARSAGKDTFTYEGKKYTTEMAGEKKAAPKAEETKDTGVREGRNENIDDDTRKRAMASVANLAKGGMVVNKGIGASMKPHNVFGSKGKK